MKLEKAIEINNNILNGTQPTSITDRRTAIKLGIEALKRTQTRRENLSWKFEPLLPGETND